MKTIRKQKYLIGVYIALLLLLLLSISAAPLLIRHEVALTDRFIIEEGTLETMLIVALFGISFMLVKGFMKTLNAYQQIEARAGVEKSRMGSMLADAFRYIGTVNVELQEIESVLCGVTRYPESKREFRQTVDELSAKAMTIASVPWIGVRMIDRHSGQTINEHSAQRPQVERPSATMGNRAILDGLTVKGLQTVSTCQRNLDFLTVFILPRTTISKEETVLLTAILNQIEMLFILYRTGGIKQMLPADRNTAKEIRHDSHH
jgi:hypothetical protein